MIAEELLVDLIQIRSYSREESGTAERLMQALTEAHVPAYRCGNNVWSCVRATANDAPWLMLNSHHDTVRPNPGYTKDPLQAIWEDDALFGLGSNDAGASLTAMFEAFITYARRPHREVHLVWSGVAEEEVTGSQGIAMLLTDLEFISVTNAAFAPGGHGFTIIGEPTGMNPAVAEKGLLVLDGLAVGRAGHAARNEGENALDRALRDIHWLHGQPLEIDSEWLGRSKITVTSIRTPNEQHNVVPDRCEFVVDVRLNEHYSPEEAVRLLQQGTESQLTPRSMRFRPKGISTAHPVVKCAVRRGRTAYGSPTCSDWSQIPGLALKMGPGDSARSHAPDEFIYRKELREGVSGYLEAIDTVAKTYQK